MHFLFHVQIKFVKPVEFIKIIKLKKSLEKNNIIQLDDLETVSVEKTFTVKNLDGDSKIDLDNLVINTSDIDETTKIYNVNPFDL